MFSEYLLTQARLHPSMTAQDAVKLCYQAAFGPGHLIADTSRAEAYFSWEFAAAADTPGSLVEPISENYCRISLPAWRKAGLPGTWLFRMFLHSAGEVPTAPEGAFYRYLETVEALAVSGRLPFSAAALRTYLAGYGQPHAVHHSDAYREGERPAYRVVSAACADLVPILQRLAALKMSCPVVAIDGRAAAGKSTTGALLAFITGGAVIHMDDFFLPRHLRTPQRLAAPGGNVHYERFSQEVLPHLGKGTAFSYGIFDCSVMAVTGRREIAESSLHIVEGSYCQHPIFGDYAHIKIFCDIGPEAQGARILHRDGAVFAEKFATQWIPMEERYFSHFAIRQQSDFVLTPGAGKEPKDA